MPKQIAKLTVRGGSRVSGDIGSAGSVGGMFDGAKVLRLLKKRVAKSGLPAYGPEPPVTPKKPARKQRCPSPPKKKLAVAQADGLIPDPDVDPNAVHPDWVPHLKRSSLRSAKPRRVFD
jgi:hypothetical protein